MKSKFINLLITTIKKNQSIIVRYSLTFFFAFLIGALFMLFVGYSPVTVYGEMLYGIFGKELYFGTVIEKFSTVLLLGLAFNICQKVRYFNLGLEGSLYTGALAFAVLGYQFPNLPGFIYLPFCMIASMIVGAAWGLLPGYFRIWHNTNEICSTLMLNYVAIQLTTYAIYYVWAARDAIPQTPKVVSQVRIPQIMPPSRASVGLFIAIAVYLLFLFIFYRTTIGYRIKTVGQNSFFAEFVGINQKLVAILTVLTGGAVAGFAGGLEVAGYYGRFMEAFAFGSTFDGLLAARLVKNNLFALPFAAFVIAALKVGAAGVERATGVPRAFVDVITSLLILFVATDQLFELKSYQALFLRVKRLVRKK